MKTIPQIAEELGVSRQAVYEKINKSGLQLSKVKKGRQVFISDEDAQSVKELFLDVSGNSQEPSSVNDRATEYKRQIDELQATVEQLRAELKEAQEKDAENQAEIQRLKGLEEQLISQIASLTEALKASQILQVQRLAAAESKPGIVGRIRQFFVGKE